MSDSSWTWSLARNVDPLDAEVFDAEVSDDELDEPVAAVEPVDDPVVASDEAVAAVVGVAPPEPDVPVEQAVVARVIVVTSAARTARRRRGRCALDEDMAPSSRTSLQKVRGPPGSFLVIAHGGPRWPSIGWSPVPGPSFAPFRHRVFALFWVGAFASNVGTIMEQVALGIYVQDRTGEAAWNGAVAALGFLPTALLGPLGGVLADRVSRRTLMLSSTSASLLLAAAMTVLVGTDHGAPAAIAAISFATGCANALAFPAFQSMLPDLVPREDLIAAIGLSGAQWNLARVVGPALAGVTVAAAGVTTALAINTASFTAVLAVLWVVHLPPPTRASLGMSVRAAFAEGARYVRRDPALWVATGTQGVNCLFASAYIGLVPAVARKVFSGDEGFTAVLSTAMGIGAVSSALTFGSLVRRFATRRVLVGVTVALPAATALYALAPTRPAAAVGLAVLAFCYLTSLSTVSSVAQVRSPAALRGRILSVNTVTLGLLYPIAVSIQGRLGDAIGLRRAMIGFAIAHVVVLGVIRLTRRGITASLDEPVVERAPAPV